MLSTGAPREFQKGFVPSFQRQQPTSGAQLKLDSPLVHDRTADGKPYKPSNKLEDYATLVTGADSAIGRSVAILFALEGANLTLHAGEKSKENLDGLVRAINEKTGGKCKVHAVLSDIRKENACKQLVQEHLDFHDGRFDTLATNHGVTLPSDPPPGQSELTDLSSEQWHDVFEANIHPFFYIVKAAVPHLARSPVATITFNASMNMAIGHPEHLDGSAAAGATIAFMRSLSNQVVGSKGIRCNGVAPGLIWTPDIHKTVTDDKMKAFGANVPMERAGQPVEVATCYVFLASPDSSYISGQVFHVNGGVVIN